MTRSRAAAAIAMLTGVLSISCASVCIDSSSRRVKDAPKLAPVDATSVAILREKPTDSVEIAEIYVLVRGGRANADLLDSEALTSELRRKAGALGANAVVDIQRFENRDAPRLGSCCQCDATTAGEVRALAIRTKT